MNLKNGLYALLQGSGTITAIVGARVYPVTLPEGATLPAIRYHVVGATTQPTLTTSGMQRWRVQFDCVGSRYEDADNLRTALIGFLNGYQGELSDGTFLQNAELIQPIDFFDSDPRQYRCAVEFYFYFTLS